MPAAAMLRLTCILAVLTVSASCSRLSPAGFWTRYRGDSIVDRFSAQGPWGGVRWVHWEASAPGTFTAADAAQFAASHEWACRMPVDYSAEQIRAWQYARSPVFPLHFGPADRPPNNRSVQKFPRHIDGDSSVIQCESGWIRVAPGSGETSPAYGYIQVDRSGTRMAVYHLWGEI